MRDYKGDTPKGTVIKIQSILEKLDVVLMQTEWNNPYDGVYSVRVEAFEEDGGFGTNGKGTTPQYSLASAYAEYIERLQNGFVIGASSVNRLFLNKIKTQSDFYFYPDEKVLSIHEFENLPEEFLEDIFGDVSFEDRSVLIKSLFDRLKENGLEGVVSVPFFNLQEKKVTYLPYNLVTTLTGSNGMAAGNNASEGLFQGICELYERNAAGIIFFEGLTPATISREILKKYREEYNIILQIEENGYEVIVKDFSCNKGLPVLGLVIIDPILKKYRLNVGSETSFKIALSRVLTEIHQGTGDQESFKSALLPLPCETTTPYFYNTDAESRGERMTQFKKFICYGGGIFPPTLFSHEESYSFNESVFKPKASYFEEVKGLIKTATNLGYNLYLRDVSHLGFPTFYIYIPGVSPIGKKSLKVENTVNFNIDNSIKEDQLEDILFPFDDFLHDKNLIVKAIAIISQMHQKPGTDFEAKIMLRLDFSPGSIWNSLQMSFLMVLLNFIIEDYKMSIYYLDWYLETNGLTEDKYYMEIRRYFQILDNNEKVDGEVSDDIISVFKDTDSMFSEIGIVNCPNCHSCTLKETCLTKQNVQNAVKINNLAKEIKIDQGQFEEFAY